MSVTASVDTLSTSRVSSTPLALTHPIAPPATNREPWPVATLMTLAVLPAAEVLPATPARTLPHTIASTACVAPMSATVLAFAAMPVGARLRVKASVALRLPSTSLRYSSRDCTNCCGSRLSRVSVSCALPSRMGRSTKLERPGSTVPSTAKLSSS